MQVPEWIWHGVSTLVTGVLVYLFQRVSKRADERRDALGKKIDDNTMLTKEVRWRVESLTEHVKTQNGRIGKLEDRLNK